MFEQEEQQQIRLRLATPFGGSSAKRLAPKARRRPRGPPGNHGFQPRTKDSVVQGEGEGKSFYEIIEASSTFVGATSICLPRRLRAGIDY